MNPMDLLKNLGDLQGTMRDVQEKLAQTTVVGEAGAGMVRVTLDGEFRLRSIEIAPEAIDREEPTLLQDLVVAAHADAHTKIKDQLRDHLSQLTGGIPIPGIFGGGA